MKSKPPPSAPSVLPLGGEDLRFCLKTLERLEGNPSALASLSHQERLAFLRCAGRLSRPSKQEMRTFARAKRSERKTKRRETDRSARAATGIREARRSPVFVAPAPVKRTPDEGPKLSRPRNCYVCKAEFRRLHFFYDSMCAACGDFNYAKRSQTAPLAGRVAAITGARLKIGYQAALMMLRAGAEVVATTRFPHDAARRYAAEPDFRDWSKRLHIHGLDLRHSPSVEIFCRYLENSLGRLDLLINNAAQTVRRPPAFYAHLMAFEALSREELPESIRPLLADRERLRAALNAPFSGKKTLDSNGLARALAAGRPASAPGIGLRDSAALSQIPYAYDEEEISPGVFPAQKMDADLQQVDLRARNTWRLTLSEVATAEMVELQLINAVAPFILCAKLKSLMLRERTGEKHIVNVSAMEGSFSRRTKTDKHPHTNMAKAALNMMTLTSAPDYARDGIFMNAVDTGWVTDEDPAATAARKREEHDFQPPLDIVDGAARVCDPFFSGLLTGNHVWGKFLKDYRPTPW